MAKTIIIEGNAVYEIDEECLRKKESRGGKDNSSQKPGEKSGEEKKER